MTPNLRITASTLNQLRSFQVIGKHLSLLRAAEELHLTASALSHQLRSLEEHLGNKLFVRTGRGLEFTDTGRRLHAQVDDGLQQLARALGEASSRGDDHALVVSALHTFATRWLLPRFHRFPVQVANTEIRVAAVHADFDRDNVDCAVCYGTGCENWPDLACDFLGEEHLVLVCAPALLGGDTPLARLEDIPAHTLLAAKFRPEDWQLWMRAAALPTPERPRMLTLASRNLVIEAAEAGLGLAVVDRVMVAKELESGRLVQPWPHAVQGPGSYYLVYEAGQPPAGKVQAFRDWLLAEFSAPRPLAP